MPTTPGVAFSLPQSDSCAKLLVRWCVCVGVKLCRAAEQVVPKSGDLAKAQNHLYDLLVYVDVFLTSSDFHCSFGDFFFISVFEWSGSR